MMEISGNVVFPADTLIHTVLLKPNTRKIVRINFGDRQNYIVFYPMHEYYLANNVGMLDALRTEEGFDLRNFDKIYEHRISIATFECPVLPQFLHHLQVWQILAFYIQPKERNYEDST